MHDEINLLLSNCLLKSRFPTQKASIVKDLHCAVHRSIPNSMSVDNNIAKAFI